MTTNYQPNYIAAYDTESGLYTYSEPFLAPEKSFPVLLDAYCSRGKVIKRPGFTLLGRLRRKVTTLSIGNIVEAWGGAYPHNETFNIFSAGGLAATEPNASIVPGTIANPITIAIGAPIAQTLTDTTGTGTLTPTAGVITAGTINYATGDITLTFSGAAGASASTVTMWYYPGLPSMGCRTYEQSSINDEKTVFFDTKYAYLYNPSTAAFAELSTSTTWNGSDSDFFWSTNYGNDGTGDLFWATNNNLTGATRDPLKYFNGATWTNFTPLVTAANTMYNAMIVVPYKGRLIAFSTWEGTTVGTITGATNNPRRARWCWIGSPIDAAAWRSDVVGNGSYIDAPTNEAITGVEFIKDTLLVKFERSSWKLVYTGNEVLPFVFQKINTELGCNSPFSLVPFDKGVFCISNYGVTTDDSVNVQRIDVQIPQVAFNFNNDNEGLKRLHGVRDYYNELVYWTTPESEGNPRYPNYVLVYNYRNNTFARYTDSFTSLGYWQRGQDLTWEQLPYTSWEEWNTPWESGVEQSLFPNVVAGNQHGFILILAQGATNSESLYIKDITASVFTVPQNNLQTGDIVKISGIVNDVILNGYTFKVVKKGVPTDAGYPNELYLYQWISGETFSPTPANLTGYIGGGVLTKINNFVIATKRFAPFYESGNQCRIGHIDFLLDTTDAGRFRSDIYVDENANISMTDSSSNPCLFGTNEVLTCPENMALLPFQEQQEKIFHRQFIQSIAQNFQIKLSMSPGQVADESISNNNFVLHAMVIYMSRNARLVQ
jgi:hypothetical protein